MARPISNKETTSNIQDYTKNTKETESNDTFVKDEVKGTEGEEMSDCQGRVEEEEDPYPDEIVIEFSIFEDKNSQDGVNAPLQANPVQTGAIKIDIQQNIPPVTIEPVIKPVTKDNKVEEKGKDVTKEPQKSMEGKKSKCLEGINTTKPNIKEQIIKKIPNDQCNKKIDISVPILKVQKLPITEAKKISEKLDIRWKEVNEEKKYMSYCSKFMHRVRSNIRVVKLREEIRS